MIWDWLSEYPLWLHAWLGYMAAALVILRVLWGSVGPSHARFVSFITGPRTIFDYLAGLVRFSSKRYIGHSPAGGAMIVALLLMIAATAGTGMATLAADEGQGPLSSVIPKVRRWIGIHDEKRVPHPIKDAHEVLANHDFPCRAPRDGGRPRELCPPRKPGPIHDYWTEAGRD